ncbi:hypothetical protein FOA52_012631 [Chlamydomonas sp. UWO 241]|nr:hypothetical protein FOA52_012631 [Chlamydomonas sp. UWO 241]
MGFAIGFAAAVPNFGRTGGWIRSEYSVKYGAVIVIFLLSGMGLNTRVLLMAVKRLPLHTLIQAISLGVTPAIGFGVVSALRPSGMSSDLIDGIIICACMPTTVSSNVVLTQMAGGNEAVALINAVVGNIIGIFISPALLQGMLGVDGQGAAYTGIIANLAVTVVAPLAVGQAAQWLLPKQVLWLQARVNFGKVGNVCVLLLVWATFCNTFYKNVSAGAGSVAVTVVVQVALYLLFTAICLAVSRVPIVVKLLRLDRADSVAIAMCGATKTIALGMPIVTVMFGDQGNVGLLALPLLIYHPAQIIIGSVLVRPLKRWVAKDADERALLHASEGGDAGAGVGVEKGGDDGQGGEGEGGGGDVQGGGGDRWRAEGRGGGGVIGGGAGGQRDGMRVGVGVQR